MESQHPCLRSVHSSNSKTYRNSTLRFIQHRGLCTKHLPNAGLLCVSPKKCEKTDHSVSAFQLWIVLFRSNQACWWAGGKVVGWGERGGHLRKICGQKYKQVTFLFIKFMQHNNAAFTFRLCTGCDFSFSRLSALIPHHFSLLEAIPAFMELCMLG